MDPNHCVAVCSSPMSDPSLTDRPESSPTTSQNDCNYSSHRNFTIVPLDKLLSMDVISEEIDTGLWTRFNNIKYSAR